MKKRRILSALVLPAILTCSLFPTASTAVAAEIEPTPEPLIKYDLPYIDDQTEMPILGYMGVPGAKNQSPTFLTKSNLMAYKNAGFNILSGLMEVANVNPPEVKRALTLCEEVELAYFVNDGKYRYSYTEPFDQSTLPSVNDLIDGVRNEWFTEYEAYAGIATRDEPSMHAFEPMKRLNAAMKQIDSTKLMYSTLYPPGANQYQLGFSLEGIAATYEHYETYVRRFVDEVKPIVLPYDHYVLYAPNSKVSDVNGENGEVGWYYKTLSLYHELAKANNIPFWITVCSWSHHKQTSICLKQNEWVVNSGLAYGAKGVQYYTYWDNTYEGAMQTAWTGQQQRGLVSLNGALHDNYYRIQKINKNIKAVDHILMQAEHKGVIQFGTQHVALPQSELLFSYGLLSNVFGDALVGCFNYNGKDVYYVVNNSCDAGTTTFKADFHDYVNVNMINGDGTVSQSNVLSVGFNLSGGEAMLLEVSQ